MADPIHLNSQDRKVLTKRQAWLEAKIADRSGVFLHSGNFLYIEELKALRKLIEIAKAAGAWEASDENIHSN